MSTVIKVEDVSKAYRLGEIGTGTLSKDLQRWVSMHVFRKDDPYAKIGEENDRTKKGKSDIVWALKDIDFKVKQGDVLGIIGKNGAGKSTLLKVLSRTTSPTTGSIKIKGRIASLLEVGTGFHPELTGRENTFLNGAILGMTKSEIKAKFDEIIDFAGIERFLDTPVKRYSSGMYVRLAFAVAAHLEPEILIVDEVLAVGDYEFQNKCLGKMKDVSGQGRTVIFVSHSMGSMIQLCSTGMLMERGKISMQGNIHEVVDHYLNKSNAIGKIVAKNGNETQNHFTTIFMADKRAEARHEYRFDEEIVARVEFYIPEFFDSFELAMRLIDKNKRAVFTIHHRLIEEYKGQKSFKFNITIPKIFLTPGSYSWIICLNHPGVSLYDLQEDVAGFTILETGSEFARYEGAEIGSVYPKYEIQNLS